MKTKPHMPAIARKSTARLARPPRSARGFTLVDLVVALSIAAILVSLAAPSFSSFIASQRASTAAVDLYVALATARSEATKRNTNVTLAPGSGGWKNGWVIADPALSGVKVLDHGPVAGALVTGPDTVVYQRSGRIRGTAPSFTLSVAGGSGSATRCVVTDVSGRPYIKSC
jgi:type IV fimbrial biogenesis protein FimT